MFLSFVFWLLLSSLPQAVTPLSLPEPNLIFSSDPLLLNRSSSPSTNLSFPWYLPHPWDDRETRMHYQFGFGFRRVPFDRNVLPLSPPPVSSHIAPSIREVPCDQFLPLPWLTKQPTDLKPLPSSAGSEMQALLAIAQETAHTGASERGYRTRYPIEDGEQRFSVNSGVLELRIANHGGGYFTWGFLQDVLEGLEVFLIVGERLYKTWFAVWLGLDTTGRSELARGKLFKVVQEADES